MAYHARQKEGRMILLGCLLAFGLAVAPRIFLVLAWIFSERWPLVWKGDFLIPLLGIIFLPYTTIMYMLVWSPTGIQGWDWLWIILGLLLDLWKWQQVIANRKQGMEVAQGYYGSGSSGSPAGGSSASRASSTSASAAASVPATAAPPASTAPAEPSGSSGGGSSAGGEPPG
jgi:hypothetical protein